LPAAASVKTSTLGASGAASLPIIASEVVLMLSFYSAAVGQSKSGALFGTQFPFQLGKSAAPGASEAYLPR
jgi:hypothetical protein